MYSSWKLRGGGPWGCGQILFRGVLGVVRKYREYPFCVLMHFYVTIFWTLPPRPPLCASLFLQQQKTERQRGREAERQRDREAERQRGRETERQRDRQTERHNSIFFFSFLENIHWTKQTLKSFENRLGKVRLGKLRLG
jgi:hypothetical protein